MKKVVEGIPTLIKQIDEAEVSLLNRRNKAIGKSLNAYFKLKRKLAKVITQDDADQ